MTKNDIVCKVDHTVLKQAAVWDDVKSLCDEAIMHGFASVCIPPSYVKQAKDYVGNKMQVCTVIGFPNGYSTTSVKVFETKDAIKNNADEIDMVINIGWVKDGFFDNILKEINEVKFACGEKILKVIIETCLLTDDEKIKLCEIVSTSNAEYIKTSTGFSSSGATFNDVELFNKYVGENTMIKAAGGISTFEDAEKFVQLGADRLGTSRMVSILDTIKDQ